MIRAETAPLARLILDRPEALHALNTAMCAAMVDALLAWRDDENVRAVVIEHREGTRGFCAGGDLRMMAESGAGDGREAGAFFRTEYQLNHLLMTFPRPVIAIMDGVTMGGGVGLALPARFRIATERTVFAMPEADIGLFPDVGGGWHLPRLPGKIGLWLALTGVRLKAADCLACGLATHFMPVEILEAARAQMAGAARTQDPQRALASGLEALSEGAGALQELTPEKRALIDRHFSAPSVEAIFDSLAQDGGAWAKAQLAALQKKSPQTLKIAFRQLALGAVATGFADVMTMEFAIATRLVRSHDFQEGVRAVIVDKDNAPAWRPARLDAISDAAIDAYFAPLPEADAWAPLP